VFVSDHLPDNLDSIPAASLGLNPEGLRRTCAYAGKFVLDWHAPWGMFYSPDPTSTFGSITGSQDPRYLEFALKFYF
jgi:hypothetical protein